MRKLLFASIAMTVALAVCTLDDLLSLHDIKADYVSKFALSHLQVGATQPLPVWTETALEWTSISVSLGLRMALIVANLVTLLLLARRLSRASGPAAAGQ